MPGVFDMCTAGGGKLGNFHIWRVEEKKWFSARHIGPCPDQVFSIEIASNLFYT
jgi:hypothetical protein